MTRREFAQAFDVSCETVSRLTDYVSLLQKWSKAINLVGANDVNDIWSRHIMDSGQLVNHIPKQARHLVDLGSGAGLPAIVAAIMASELIPDLRFTLIESDKRKAAFLREACRQSSISATIRAERAENIEPLDADVVTSRAFAPLRDLLGHAITIAPRAQTLLLHKGRQAECEIADARVDWGFSVTKIASRTSPDGCILKITDLGAHL